MNSGDSTSQNKRKERVRSIFDSDDSDEDNDKAFGHSPSNDEDEDDLRKQIDEVCFNLSNEEEKLELGSAADKGPELSIPMPTFTMDEVTGSNSSQKVDSDREELDIPEMDKRVTDPLNLEDADNDSSDSETFSKHSSPIGDEKIGFVEEMKDVAADELSLNMGKETENQIESLEDTKVEEEELEDLEEKKVCDDQIEDLEKILEKDDQIEGLEEVKDNENQTENLEEQMKSENQTENIEEIKECEELSEKFEQLTKCKKKIILESINPVSDEVTKIIEKDDERENLIDDITDNQINNITDNLIDDNTDNEKSKICEIVDKDEDETMMSEESDTESFEHLEPIEQDDDSINFEVDNDEEENKSDPRVADKPDSELSEVKDKLEYESIESKDDLNKADIIEEITTKEGEVGERNISVSPSVDITKDITESEDLDIPLETSELEEDNDNLVDSEEKENDLNETKDIENQKLEIKDENTKADNILIEQTEIDISKSSLLGGDTAGISAVQEEASSTKMDIAKEFIENRASNDKVDHENFEEDMEVDKVEIFHKLKATDKDQITEENEKNKLLDMSIDKISYSMQINSPNNETESKFISKKSAEKNTEEQMEIDNKDIKLEIELKEEKIIGNDLQRESKEMLKNLSKDSDLANLSDVWNTVNIFQASSTEQVSLPNLTISKAKADISPEFRESDSDSGTDVKEKEDSNLQLIKDGSQTNEIQENIDAVEFAAPAQVIKDNTSSPWEAMKNGSLFEDIQVLQGQSPDYQMAESLKRKKVRVEDVFTDSEGEESLKKSLKIKNGHEILIDRSQDEVKKIKHKRVRATSINLPAIMLAFEKGWVREVVYRSSSGIANKRADIYYYSPSLRKLRSRVELEDFLMKNNITDLGLQNFSFFKEPLGVEEKYERIRHASNLVKLGDSSALALPGEYETPLPKKRARKPTSKVKESPPMKKAKTKEVVKKVLIKEAISKTASAPVKRKPAATIPTITTTISKPVYQIASSDVPVYATHLYPANPPLTYARIITPVIRGEAKDKTFHCTPACEAGGGNVPSLQCVKCVCLFHSECCQMPPQTVSLILSSVAKFLCPNCYREENITKNYLEEFKPSLCFEPLAFDPSSESEDEGMVSDFEHPTYTRVNQRPKTPPLPPFSPLLDPSKQFSTFRTPSLNVPMLQQQQCVPPPPNFQTQQAQLPQLIPNLPLAVPLPCTSSAGPTSFLLYQPINKNPMFQQTTIVPSSQIAYNLPPQPPIPALTPLTEPPTQKAVPERQMEKPTLPQIAPGVRGGKYFLQDMSSAYQIMRKIFVYMSVPDLLMISRVCVMWRDLALSPFYWNSVRLRNVCVKDWEKMVEFLDRRGTTELDLRKMVIYSGLIEEKPLFSDNEEPAAPNEEINPISVDERTDYETHNTENIEEKTNEDEEKEKDANQIEEKETENIIDENDVEMKSVVEEGVDAVSGNVKVESESPTKILSEGIVIKEVEVNTFKDETHKSPLKNVSISETFDHEMMDVEKHEEEFENMKTEEEIQKELEEQREKEEIERKEKEEKEKMSYIVSSVLSEHDYFGRVRTVSSSSSGSSSSSNSSSSSESGSGDSSSDSSDSETHMDITEEEMERSLQKPEDKIKIESPPEERLEVTKILQDQPQSSSSSSKLDVGTEEVGDKPSELIVSPQKEITANKPETKEEDTVVKESPVQVQEEAPPDQQSQEPCVNKEWQIIANALSKMNSLRKLVVGTYDSSVAEVLLASCHQLSSFSSLSFDAQTDADGIRFDPSVLMQTRNLEELRLSSQNNFTFKSNFNFIKLPRLKILMLKGLKTTDIGWPYLGIQLTHLYLSSISTFSHNNWLNISAMTDLLELELDGSGNDHDTELCTALGKLTKLTRLTLFDWNIGSKLPHTLKRLHNIKYLHIIPAIENQNMRGVYAGRLMVILESAKHLDEFIWGIQPQNIIMDEMAGEKIFMLNMKAGKETGSVEGEEVRSVSIDSLKGFIKCRIPQTKISVKKVSSNLWTWSSFE